MRGLEVSVDGVCYASAAQNLLEGRGLTVYDNETPLVHWPPLLSISIAAVKTAGGMDWRTAMLWINLVSFALAVGLTGWWGFRMTGSRLVGLWSALGVLLAEPLLEVSWEGVSEPLYVSLAVAALIALTVHAERGTSRSLLAAALLAALACLTRYLGVALIGAGAAVVLLGHGDRRERLIRTAWFVAISSAPLGLWLMRNLAVSGTLAGPRFPSTFPLVYNLMAVVNTVSSWALPGRVPFIIRALAVALGALLVLTLALHERGERDEEQGMNLLLPAFGFILFHLALTVAGATLSSTDRIGDRLLVPIYAPVLVVAGASAWRAFNSSRTSRIAFMVVLFAALAYPAARVGKAWSRPIHHGFERGESPIIEYLRSTPIDRPIYSNNPFVIRSRAGLAARMSDYDHPYNMPVPEADGHGRIARAPAGSLLVWFNDSWSPFIAPETLEKTTELVPIATFSDGVIYRIGGKDQGASGERGP